MKILFGALMLVICGFPAFSSGESVTLFLDGARIEHEVTARKGYLEWSHPSAMLQNSLRVKPVGTCEVVRVEHASSAAGAKTRKELAALNDRRTVLQDRLKSLEERQEVFKSAAKSQSSKALRKSKNNPEPLEALRKGTDFALSHLESVNAAMRKTEKDLAAVEARISALQKAAGSGGTARIWLSKPDGKARVSCLVSGFKWVPWYDFRLAGNGYAEIILRARLQSGGRPSSLSVAPVTLADAYGSNTTAYPVSPGNDSIASYRIKLTREDLTRGPASYLSVAFINTTGQVLPAGDASGYWQGEYLGKTSFGGCRNNESLSIVFGK